MKEGWDFSILHCVDDVSISVSIEQCEGLALLPFQDLFMLMREKMSLNLIID
jgi:hypothetical protein